MKEKDSRAQFNMSFGLENKNDHGTVKLHESVIASVVKNATYSIDGIIRLAGSSLTDSLAGFLGTRRRTDGSVKIVLSENSATVEVNVVVEYGKSIPDLSLQLQNTIIDEVKKITGMTVSQVNINVHGVEERAKEEIIEEPEKDQNNK